MKKIIFKSGSTQMGGLEKVQIEYINFLVKNNYDLKVIIENDNGIDNVLEKELDCEVIYLKDFDYIAKIKDLRNSRKQNLYNKIKYNFALFQERKFANEKFNTLAKNFNPDIIIDFDSSLTSIIQNFSGKKIIWIHSSIVNWKKKKSKINSFVKKLEKYDKIICICNEMAKELSSINNKLQNKIEILYNPINFQVIEEKSNLPFSEEELTLANNNFLLMVSRLDTTPKDFATLFKAFDIAKENGYSGKLYLIGEGQDREKVENMKNNSKYKFDIFLLGQKNNPYNWMKKADKFILSSKYEGFGQVLIEALIVNNSVISSNCKTGPSEILDNGNIGKLFEVGDYKTLASFITKNTQVDRNIINNHLKKFDKNIILENFKKILN